MFKNISLGLHRRHLALLVTTASLSLTGCFGGGGGGGGGDDNPNFGNADAFRTDEYNTAQALDRINAADGYARIPGVVGGGGVQVAVIDDGVDSDHEDLDDNVVFDSGVIDGQVELNDTLGLGVDGHGTAVAGVIAAEKNDNGFHGVAFDADIAAYDYSSFDPTSLTTSIGADQVNNAVQFVDQASGAVDGPGGESDIMNFSWGFDGTSTDPDEISDVTDPGLPDAVEAMGDALERAADRDKIMVFAAPNNIVGTGFLEEFVIDPRIEGHGIAVVAVNENNVVVSEGCGITAEFCLAAPGTNVDVTLPGDQVDELNGTSFAAPLVSGSAAVVKAAFPGVSSEEIVRRLLDTATPLPGQDAGQGLLNLEAALDPDGDFSIALGTSLDGPRAAFANSQVSIDSSATLGGDAAKLLGDAIVFDEQNFPFAIDLERNVDRRSRTTGLDSFVGADRGVSTVQNTDYGSVSLSFSDEQRIEDPYRAEFEESDVDLKEEAFDPKVRFQSEVTDGIDVFMSLNGTSATDLGLGQSLAADQGSFFQQSTFLAPFEKLAGLQSGGGAAYELNDDTKIAVTAFAAADDEALTQVSMQKVELVHRTVGDIELRAGYGFLQEEGGFLGSSTSGAFGEGTSTDSQYVNVSLKAPLSETVSLFGAYTQGRSSTSTGSSLLSDFSSTRSEAFGAGLVVQDLVKDGDGFSLMVGQPLRVTSGSADVTVAVGRTEDGEVLTETARADLSPDAREITTEAVYDFSLDGETHSLSTGAFARFNPDNDPDASPDLGFGVKYQLTF